MYSRKALSILSLLFMIALVSCFFTTSSGGVSFFALGTETSNILVKSEAELKNAINKAPDKTLCNIDLTADIVLENTLEIPNGKDILLVGVGGVWKLVGANNQNTIVVAGVLTIDNICVTHADGAVGRGVYIESSGTFTMLGGVISGNTAVKGNGGGVYNKLGTFAMCDGEITGNAANMGGGVCHVSNNIGDGVWDVGRDGAIYGNTATNYGGDFPDITEISLTSRPSIEYRDSSFLLFAGASVIVAIAASLLFYRSKKQKQNVAKNLIASPPFKMFHYFLVDKPIFYT